MKIRIAILLMGLLVLFLQSAQGASYEDAPNLEPFALTQDVIDELTQTDNNATKGSTFCLKGITISATEPKGDGITLTVDTDRRLDLWRGRPNDIASSHLGSMELIVTAMTDETGQNVYDASQDKPWSNSVTIYHRGNGVFNGSRTAYFKKTSESKIIKQVAGKIQLVLPVNLKRYEIRADDPESIKPLLEQDDISEIELNNGLAIKHPVSTPDFKITIMGFDKEGKRISIVSAGTAGKNNDNHWYYFSTKTDFDKMIIFIPEKFIVREIPFTIDMQTE